MMAFEADADVDGDDDDGVELTRIRTPVPSRSWRLDAARRG